MDARELALQYQACLPSIACIGIESFIHFNVRNSIGASFVHVTIYKAND